MQHDNLAICVLTSHNFGTAPATDSSSWHTLQATDATCNNFACVGELHAAAITMATQFVVTPEKATSFEVREWLGGFCVRLGVILGY